MKKRICINGFEWWLDEANQTLSETKEETGTSLKHINFTSNERTQIYNQTHYQNDRQ